MLLSLLHKLDWLGADNSRLQISTVPLLSSHVLQRQMLAMAKRDVQTALILGLRHLKRRRAATVIVSVMRREIRHHLSLIKSDILRHSVVILLVGPPNFS